MRRAEDLYGFVLRGTDGTLGRIHDLYFDDRNWTVRYIALNTGSWPIPRFVLLSPCVLRTLAWDKRRGSVQLTKEQVNHGPEVELSPVLSAAQCAELDAYYGWPIWTATGPEGSGKWGEGCRTVVQGGGSLLQSAREIPAYRIDIGGTEMGRAEDLLFDDGLWTVRYLVVDCWSWPPGRRQLIPPECVHRIGRSECKIYAQFRHRLAPTG